MNIFKTRMSDINYFNQNQYKIEGSMCLESNDYKPGDPTLLFIGATHGNEPSGVKAIVQIHKELIKNKSQLKKGRIIFILGNPKAYLEDKRYIDQDLNRSFIDNTKVINYESSRARELKNFFRSEKNIVSGLDIHSVSKGDDQLIVYNKTLKKCFELARICSPISNHLSYHKDHIPGLLVDALNKTGTHAIALECGNNIGKYSKKVAAYHIYKMCDSFKIFDGKNQIKKLEKYVDSSENIYQYETIGPIIPKDNFKFTQDFATGSKIKKDQTFARTSNKEIIAKTDCYIVMPAKRINEKDADAGFLCSLNLISA